MKKFLIAAIAALAFTATPALSQEFLKGGYLQGNLGGSFATEKTDTRDLAPAGGVAAGYDFGQVRVEGEYFRSSNGDNGGGRIGNVKTDTLSLNVYAEPFTFRNVTPFVVGGVGYTWADGSGVRSDKSDGMVYTVGAGASYSLTANWSLVGQYRYSIADDIQVRQNDGSFDNYKAHIVTVGVRYGF